MGRGGGRSKKSKDYRAYYPPQEFSRNEQPSVLIVDDDIESAHLMKHMFEELGFHTELALSADEAFKMACSTQPDLVILDWLLGINSTGEDVLKRLKDTYGKYETLNEDGENKHLDIVTFSQLKSTDIKIPTAQYFRHLEHWRKPIGYKALVERALGLLDRMDM